MSIKMCDTTKKGSEERNKNVMLTKNYNFKCDCVSKNSIKVENETQFICNRQKWAIWG